MKGQCWNCGKMNNINQDGYAWCNCKDSKDGSGGLWYKPVEKDLVKSKQKQIESFLDGEESNG